MMVTRQVGGRAVHDLPSDDLDPMIGQNVVNADT
jgi:hypothetical protein